MMNQPYSGATFFGIFKNRVEVIPFEDLTWRRLSPESPSVLLSGGRKYAAEVVFEQIECSQPLAILKDWDHSALTNVLTECALSGINDAFYAALDRVQSPDVLVDFRPSNVTERTKLSLETPAVTFSAIDHSQLFFEGTLKRREINEYERNTAARKACLEQYGYRCYICDFDFESAFGEAGKNVIEVHHIKPIAEGERYTLVSEDLRPICPNCHTIVHRRNPPFSVNEVMEMRKLSRVPQRTIRD